MRSANPVTEPKTSAAETLDEAVDPARLRHVVDLEVAGHDRPVTQEPPQQALLDLDCAEARKAHGRRATVERPVHDEQLLSGQDEARPLPLPHRAKRNDRAS